jgi:sec-independent protein translocase protein TatC
LPVLIVLLTKMGMATSKGLREKRKYAVLIAFVVAAILTPPDVISQVMLAVPVILLYEISILCSQLIEKRRGDPVADDDDMDEDADEDGEDDGGETARGA